MNFKNKTNWVVITGAPSSGKTSVIDDLARRGFATQVETARAVIAAHLAAGRTLEQVRADGPALQREIMAAKVALEAALDPQSRVFLDRGMDDSISYFRAAGMEIAPAVEASKTFRYRAVFIFDRLPMVNDEVRSEDDAAAARLDHDLEQDYRMMGYDPVRVPVMPIGARTDFVLARVRD